MNYITIAEICKWIQSHVLNFFSGFAVAFLGYFSPVKEVIHVMIAAIMLDLLLGITAAVKTGIGIRSYKLWRTGYKLLISTSIVMLMYAIDKEMHVMELHRIFAWLICGFEVWSMLENAGKITDNPVFLSLQRLMEDKLKIKDDDSN